MESSYKGIYIGPKDGDIQSDYFVKSDETHITVFSKEAERELEICKEAALFIRQKAVEMEEAVRKKQAVSFKYPLNMSSMLKITTSDVASEMIDIRIWFKNCIGRWAPTRKGARMHYVHMMNFLNLIDDFLN